MVTREKSGLKEWEKHAKIDPANELQLGGRVWCIAQISHGNAAIVGSTLASYPGPFEKSEKGPGIHCSRMRLIST